MSFYGKCICVICGNEVDDEDRFLKSTLATSGAYLPDNDIRLYYTAMHWNCYINWDKRKEYALKYTKTIIENEQTDINWAKVYLDNNFFIIVSLIESIDVVRIIPLCTGEFIDIKIGKWSEWALKIQKDSNKSEFDKELFDMLVPVLVSNFATKESILNKIDWKKKQELKEKFTFECKQIEESKLQEIKIYNKKLNELNKSKLTCPKCNCKNSRYVDRNPNRKSYFICKECGRSFGLEDTCK